MFQFRQMLTIAFLAAMSLECAVLHAQVSFSYQTYALKNTPQFVVSGDLNGDGKPDLVVSSQNGNILSVLLNNGNGTFAPELELNPIPNFFAALAVGDFNRDKKLNILALHLAIFSRWFPVRSQSAFLDTPKTVAVAASC